eukprot:jgi/Tetstr1/461934/TSEL_007012.t1
MSRSKTTASPGGSPTQHVASSPKTPNVRRDSASHTYSNFAAQMETEGGPYSPTLYSSRSAADVGYNMRSGPPPLVQEGSYPRNGRVGSARGSPVKQGRPGSGAGGGQRRMAKGDTLSLNLPMHDIMDA